MLVHRLVGSHRLILASLWLLHPLVKVLAKSVRVQPLSPGEAEGSAHPVQGYLAHKKFVQGYLAHKKNVQGYLAHKKLHPPRCQVALEETADGLGSSVAIVSSSPLSGFRVLLWLSPVKYLSSLLASAIEAALKSMRAPYTLSERHALVVEPAYPTLEVCTTNFEPL